MATGIQLKVEIDFVNDAMSATDTFTDVTADLDGPVSFVSGRSRLADTYQPGTGQLRFHDPFRVYDPSNSLGPHFGQFGARRKIRITAKRADAFTYHPVFRGFIESWSPDFAGTDGEANRTTVRFTDGVPLLKLQRLPESVWEETIKAETGVTAWYRWRDHEGSAVAVDSSGNVNNGVYKRALHLNAGTAAAVWAGVTEHTAYDLAGYKRSGMIPYGGDKDRGWDINAQITDSSFSYEAYQNQLRPALGWMHAPAGIISGRNWSFECWAQWSTGWRHTDTGVEDRKNLPVAFSTILTIGASGPTEDLHILSVQPNNFTSDIDLIRVGVVPSGTWQQVVGAFVTRDGEPHHIVMTSEATANPAQSQYRLYFDGVHLGVASVNVDPVGAGQLIGFAYPSWAGWFNGAIGESVFYNRALSLAEVQEHWTAGSAPGLLNDAGTRIVGALTLGGWPNPATGVEVGAGTMSPTYWNSQPVWDYVERLAISDGASLWIDETGVVKTRNRYAYDFAPYNTPAVEFLDTGLQVADAIQLSSTTFTKDLSQLVNYCQVETEDGEVLIAEDLASQAAYGRRDRVIRSTAVRDDAEGLAGWVIANRANPVATFTEVSTDAMDNHSIDALLSSALIGERCSITRALQHGSALSAQLVISSKRWKFNPDLTYECTLGLDPPPVATAWTLA